MLDALPYICMVRCGCPAVFMWLCKLYTIEDHVLCHVRVVSSINLLKDEESRRRHVLLKLYSAGEPVQCIHRLPFVLNNAATHNTSRRTAAAARLVALCACLQPWCCTARGLRSFGSCTNTRMQLAGRNGPCKQCCASGLQQQYLLCTEGVAAVRRTLQRLRICPRETFTSSPSSNPSMSSS